MVPLPLLQQLSARLVASSWRSRKMARKTPSFITFATINFRHSRLWQSCAKVAPIVAVVFSICQLASNMVHWSSLLPLLGTNGVEFHKWGRVPLTNQTAFLGPTRLVTFGITGNRHPGFLSCLPEKCSIWDYKQG